MADQQNPFSSREFREELSDVFDEKLTPVTRLLEQHAAKLDEHEAALQRARGARWALGVIWAGILAGLEWLFHSGRN